MQSVTLSFFSKYSFHKIALILLAIILLDGLSGGASAQIFSLFLREAQSCPPPALDKIFSGFLCEYEKLLDQVMNVMYNGILQLMNAPFFAFLTLFVTCTALLFLTGIVPFSIRDFMLIFFKICIVMVLATNPEFMIDYLYIAIVTFAQGTTDAVLEVLAPDQGSIQGIFKWIDNVFFQFLKGQGANATADPKNNDAVCNNNVLALLFGLAVTIPPVFGMAVYVLFQMAFAFFKTIMSYVIAMTGIMFLTALSPLFLMFALFKFTSEYFEAWLKFLIGFAIQIFVVFAVVGVVINLITSDGMKTRINTVLAMVQPYDKTIQHDGHSFDFNGWCSLCISGNGGGGRPTACKDALSPTSLQAGGTTDFLQYLGSDLFYIGIMAYIMNILLTQAPELARSLVAMVGAPSYSGNSPVNSSALSQEKFEKQSEFSRQASDRATGGSSQTNAVKNNIVGNLFGGGKAGGG